MEKTKLKEYISGVVAEKPFITAMELGMMTVKHCVDEKFPIISSNDFQDLLDEMIERREIISIDYVLPSMNYRQKQRLVPSGTHIRIKGA